MSEKEEKPKKNSRRVFLQQLGMVGVGTVLGGSAILAGINYDKKKTQGSRIKVLSAENELLEIEKSDTTKVIKTKLGELTYLQKQGRT
ncbi:MAG: hypothetical protein ACYC25_13285, partial [Paludibacter sp.]